MRSKLKAAPQQNLRGRVCWSMGIYLRESVSVGPFRFNFSKSGIGVSAGGRAFRVGSGPRGNYVRIGRGALQYRVSLSPGRTAPVSPTTEPQPLLPASTHEPLREIESGDVLAMVDSSAADLLAELNEKRQASRRAPGLFVLTILVLFVGLGLGLPVWIWLPLTVLAGILTYRAHRNDQVRRSVILFYELTPEMEKAYQQLLNAATAVASCARIWHIEAEGKIRDRKYHAGASNLVQRKGTRIAFGGPPMIKTNIATVALGVGRQVLYLFPDRALVFGPNGVGAVGYRDLRIDLHPQRFIEEGFVPSDARVVDQTWQYVNKSGGPDRRFKNNRQLPVCLYEELCFTSTSGLNEVIQLSRQGVAEDLVRALRQLAANLPNESGRATA